MNPAENIERSVAKLSLTTKTETDRRILDDAFDALRDGLQSRHAHRQEGFWHTVLAGSRMARPLAAAAVILVALTLFLSIPGKTGTIKEMYGALGKVRNICVSTFQAGRTEPNQQVWTSETLKVKMFKSGSGNQAQYALLDIPSRTRMTLYLSTVRTEKLTDAMLTELEKSVTPVRDVAPFSDAGDVPEDAQWKPVEDSQVAGAIPGAIAYDLIWTETSGTPGGAVYRMWRFFIDARSGLPRRTEHYAKTKPDEEYVFETFSVVSYPTESEIKDLIRNTFGPPESRYDNPEPIGTPGANR